MRFVMTLKSIFLTLSRYTYLESSQKFGPEKCNIKYREVTRQNPKAESSAVSSKLHYPVWTPTPRSPAAQQHHRVHFTTAFGDVTVTNICHAVCFHIPLLLCSHFTERPTWVYILLDTMNGLPGAPLLNDPKILRAI